MGPSAWNHGTWGSAEAQFAEPLNWRGAIFMPDGLVRIAGVARSAGFASTKRTARMRKILENPAQKVAQQGSVW
jgi:hypothetical protein